MEKLQPKLRFPEFKDEWKNQPLKCIGEIIGGGTPSTTIEEYWNGEINWFTPSEITSKYISSSKRKITDLGVNKSSAKILPKGSILLTTRATIGESSICLEESTTNQGFQSIVVNQFNNNEFVYYLINTLKNELIKNSSGSTFLEISKRKIELINNYFPSLEEQTKIAEFLGSVDKQLELLNTKKEKLTLYKKGVMQQLFSQQLRFKDDNGNDYPEWEEKILGEIVDVRDGTHDSPKYISDSKFYLLTSKNLTSNGKLDFNDIKYLKESDFNKINTRSKVDYGDILFGMIGTIGNPVLIKQKEINFAIKNMALLKKSPNVYNEFLLYQFKSFIIEIQFRKLNTGNTQKFISLSTIRNLKIYTPILEEQTKIANFLSAIDKQIETVETEITKTEVYKKGLLQQMFV